MPRAVRFVLILIPLGLVAAALFVWVRNATKPPEVIPPDEVQFKTEVVDGVTFEVEHEMKEGVNLFRSAGACEAYFSRRGDLLEYRHGLLTINEIGLPDVQSGDKVRWNLSGPVLLNGQPMQPHELQAKSIEAAAFDADWNAEPSQYPRDTLSLAWIGAGHKLAVAHGDGVIRVWDADTHLVLKALKPEAPSDPRGRAGQGLRVAASPDGKRLASVNMFGEQITVWEWEKDAKPETFTSEPKAKVRQVAFANDKTLLEARGESLRLRPLDGSAAKILGSVHNQFEPPFAVHVKSGLVAWSDGKKLHLGPIGGPAVEREPFSNGCFAFSADGSLLAAFNGDNRLSLIDPKTGKETKRLRWRGKLGATDGINALAFAPDGRTLAAACGDSVRFYDVPTGRERGGVASPWVRDLAYSADGKLLAAGLRYKPGIRLWNTADLVAK